MSTRLGKWLRLVRGESGQSLRAVAARAGVSHVYLSEIERGKACSADKVLVLADAVGGSLEEAARLWSLDRASGIERDMADARHRYRMGIVHESHRLAGGGK